MTRMNVLFFICLHTYECKLCLQSGSHFRKKNLGHFFEIFEKNSELKNNRKYLKPLLDCYQRCKKDSKDLSFCLCQVFFIPFLNNFRFGIPSVDKWV